MVTLTDMLYCEIDLIGIAMLMVIFVYNKKGGLSIDERVIISTIIGVTATILVADALCWVIEGRPNISSTLPMHIFEILFFGGTVLACVLWLSYCDVLLINKPGLLSRSIIYCLPCTVFFIVLLINIKTGWIYYYDDKNVYHRGPLVFIHMALVGLYMLYSVYMIHKNAKGLSQVKKHDAYSLMFFILPPVICAAVQLLFFSVSLVPVGMSFSLLILFVQRQAALVTIDNLTHLNNRRTAEQYLEQSIRNRPDDMLLFALMIDMDDFKSINDTHGHLVGDQALIETADIFRSCCLRTDCLARMGGDEFIIFGRRRSEGEVEAYTKYIYAAFDKRNEITDKPFKLCLSIGAAYMKDDDYNINDFLGLADASMYREKWRRKTAKN